MNLYLYNGKELNTDFDLNWIDYGARYYDPAIARFSTTDRFAEKYYSMTPYQYGANNPISFIDINGDSIYFVNTNQDLDDGMATLQRTKDGQELIDKYSNSDEHDIYIGTQSFGESLDDKNAATTAEVENSSMIVDGKISIPEDSPLSKTKSSLDGVDVSKSKGKKISIVTFNSDNTSKRNKYDNAETIFHEIKAHIDINVGGQAADHKAYGLREWKWGNDTVIDRKAGTPAGIINKQLQGLKNKDNE